MPGTINKRWLLAAALGVMLATAGWWARTRLAPRFHGTTFEELTPAPDFALLDHAGRPVTRASFAGRPALLFFGFTRCPDVCPLTLTRLSRALDRAGARDIQVLLVTVDPAHDTPAVLADYVGRFGGRVTGLTGDSAAVAHAMAGYGAYRMPAAHREHGAPASLPGHSAVIYGLDSQGRLQVVISEGAGEDALHDDVRALSRL